MNSSAASSTRGSPSGRLATSTAAGTDFPPAVIVLGSHQHSGEDMPNQQPAAPIAAPAPVKPLVFAAREGGDTSGDSAGRRQVREGR